MRAYFGRLFRPVGLPALLCAAALLAGCAGVKVGSISPADYLAQRRGDVLTTGELSTSAQEVLRVIGSDADLCRKGGPACRAALADSPGLTDEQRLSALSEVWLQVALAADKGKSEGEAAASPDAAIEAWLETARHAYAYLFFTARKPRDRAEMRAFRLENPCPATGLVQDICPGWHVGYITPLCDNGTDTRTNMRWMTLEDKRFMTAANGKDCSKRKHPLSTLR